MLKNIRAKLMSNNSNKNKLSNKIAIILSIFFIVIGGGYFIYDEVVYKNKDIVTIIPLLLMFPIGVGIYFLLKRGFSIMSIKILIIVVCALLLGIGSLWSF